MQNDKDLPFRFFKKNVNPELPGKLFFKPYSELTDKEKEDLEKIKLTPSPTPASSVSASSSTNDFTRERSDSEYSYTEDKGCDDCIDDCRSCFGSKPRT